MLMSNMMHGRNTKKYLNYLSYILLGVSAIAILWFGYSLYSKRQEESASRDLAENIDGYYKALSKEYNANTWQIIEQAFAVGSRRHSSSKLYPYFLAYQADALLSMGKHDEAVGIMDKAVASLGKSQTLYPLYSIKRALMKRDSKTKNLHDEGVKELEAIAADIKNPMQAMAIYYQGLESWSNGDKKKAISIWNEMVNKGKKDSQWYQLALEKMQ